MNLALVVLAGVLPLLCVVLATGWERREHELLHASQTNARLVEYYGHQQEQETERIRTILAAMAAEPEVRALNVEACNALFRDMLLANPEYVNFALLDRNGEALASALAFTKQNLAGRKEVQEVLATGAFAVGEYAVGKVSGVQILPFAYPVRDKESRIHGVLIATLRLQELASIFDQAQMPPDSFIGLADWKGRRLYRYPSQPNAGIGQMISPDVWDKVSVADRQTLFTAVSTDGVRRVYAVRRIALGNGTPFLNIFVGIPEQGILKNADAATWKYLQWLGGSLLLSIVLALLIGKFGISDQMARLVGVAQRLGAGDLSARTGMVVSNGSLGQLAQAVDHMAQALERDREELVQANEARELEVLRRQALMDLSSDGIVVIDQQQRVVEANSRFAEMLGLTTDAVLGRSIWDFQEQSPDDFLRNSFIATARMRAVFETVYRRQDGSAFPVEVSAAGSEVFGEPLVFVVVRDSTARKKAERRLQESEERYRMLFEDSTDAISVHAGIPPRFALVNPAFTRLLGYSAEEIYAMESKESEKLLHPADREAVKESLRKRLTGEVESVRHTFRIICKDGTTRWVNVTGRRLSHGGEPMNMSIYRDVTEEHETRELLARAKEAAESASQAKSEFLANMSHEVRTPLNGVMGMLQLLAATRLDEDQAEYATAALQSCCRLTRLLADILDLSRIEAGKMPMVHEPLLLDEVFSHIRDLFLAKARDSGLALQFHVDPALSQPMLGDAFRLQQVLINLVGNALKFTAKGHVGVEAYPLPRRRPGEVRVLFTVYDTGIGISDRIMEQIFRPFSQGGKGFTRKYQGAGLGLAICKRLVELMGGTIAVESEEGAGTSVHFCITFGDVASAAVAREGDGQTPERARAAVAAQAPGQDLALLHGLRVLVAEDDKVSAMVAAKVVEKAGATATVVGDGQQVLDALRATAFDVVLMDVQMPVLDGVEATLAIRQGQAGEECRNIPIIALTAYAMTGDADQFLQAGMNGYLAKPIACDELARVVGNILPTRA